MISGVMDNPSFVTEKQNQACENVPTKAVSNFLFNSEGWIHRVLGKFFCHGNVSIMVQFNSFKHVKPVRFYRSEIGREPVRKHLHVI